MNVAVVFAGGIGSRMNSRALPKQFLEVHGKPILVHTLEKFENHPEIDAIALAILPEWREHTERIVRRYELTKVRWIVNGGATGQESRHKALRTVAADVADATDVVVLIHDGVRPLITAAAHLREHRGRARARQRHHLHQVQRDGRGERDQTISDVIPRDHIYAAQAPQTFHLDEILGLYDDAVARGEHDSIDSCTLMQSQGRTLYRVDGPALEHQDHDGRGLLRVPHLLRGAGEPADRGPRERGLSRVVEHDVAEIIGRDLPWHGSTVRTVLVTGANGMLPPTPCTRCWRSTTPTTPACASSASSATRRRHGASLGRRSTAPTSSCSPPTSRTLDRPRRTAGRRDPRRERRASRAAREPTP